MKVGVAGRNQVRCQEAGNANDSSRLHVGWLKVRLHISSQSCFCCADYCEALRPWKTHMVFDVVLLKSDGSSTLDACLEDVVEDVVSDNEK